MISAPPHREASASSLPTFDIEPPSCVAIKVLPFIGTISDLHIKRLKSVEKEEPYRYLDLFFLNFDNEPNIAHVEKAANNASTENEICGCYKLLQTKKRLDTTGTVQSRRLEERTRKCYSRYSGKLTRTDIKRFCRGYIFLAYKTMDDMSTEKLEQNWKSWSGVRLICELMKPFTFRRLSLYKHCFRDAQFRYIILIQTEHLLLSPEAFLNVINYLRQRVNAHIALYREIDFSLRDNHMGTFDNPQILVAKHNLPLHHVSFNFPTDSQKNHTKERRENRSSSDGSKKSQPGKLYEMRMFSTKNDELDDTLQISILEPIPDPAHQPRTLQHEMAQVPPPAPRSGRPLSALAFYDSFLGVQNETIDLSDVIQVSPNGSMQQYEVRNEWPFKEYMI